MNPLLSALEPYGILDLRPVAGGDVNLAFKAITAGEPLFLLVQPGRDESFFSAEIAGLQAMAQADIQVPRVLGSGAVSGQAYLLLSYIESGRGDQRDLGSLLAKLHRVQGQAYGFHLDYPGQALTLDNTWQQDWAAFFVHQRLDRLAQALIQKGAWSQCEQSLYGQARSKILDQLSQHDSIPALLHGDLWAGNFMFDTQGQPYLIDPASFYGDREFDIGVSTVFPGFSPVFYQGYQEAYPLAPGHADRLEFYRLYFLMLHQVKFGQAYSKRVLVSMQQICRQ